MNRTDPQNDRLSQFLHDEGIPPGTRGYYYLKRAARIASEDPSLLDYLHKGLYSTIAEETGTSVSCVERNIRYALRETAETNRTFIAKLTEKLIDHDHGRTGKTHQRTGEKE